MLSIGQAAKRTGIRVGTIRYYEAAGILPKARRGPNRRRLYDEADIGRLEFIRRARELDFNMRSVRALLNLQNMKGAPCATVSRLAAARVAEIEREIARLTALRHALSDMIECCGNRTVADCRVIAGLSADGSATSF